MGHTGTGPHGSSNCDIGMVVSTVAGAQEKYIADLEAEVKKLEDDLTTLNSQYDGIILRAQRAEAEVERLRGELDYKGLARRFHESYEALAPSYGYATRPETRIFDPESPNGRLMEAVCREVFSAALRGEEGKL